MEANCRDAKQTFSYLRVMMEGGLCGTVIDRLIGTATNPDQNPTLVPTAVNKHRIFFWTFLKTFRPQRWSFLRKAFDHFAIPYLAALKIGACNKSHL